MPPPAAPDWRDLQSWHDPTHKIMAAQGVNLERIEPGLDLGTDVLGNDAICVGPKPLVVMYGAPPRFFNQNTLVDVERFVMIGPMGDKTHEGRTTQRDGRMISYLVACTVSLSRAEQEQDQAEGAADFLLGRKVDAWMHDFRRIFNDNDHLIFPTCPTGLVDDAGYDVVWDPESQWPYKMVIAHVTCMLHA